MMFPLRDRPWVLGLTVAVLLLAADQASKVWVLSQPDIVLVGVTVTSFFNLVLVWNTGVSFGLMAGGPEAAWVFATLAVAVSTALGGWMLRARPWWIQLSLGAIIGGAIGNVVDRIRFGAVVDFLDFHWRDLHWYTFNLADAGIVLGAMGILADSLFFSENSTIKDKDETTSS